MRILLASVVSVSVVALSACAAFYAPHTPQGLPPSDVPNHFIGAQEGEGAAIGPDGQIACRNPLVDPRNGTRITLVRSSGGEGDYQVPLGMYGVAEDQILRIECATGRPIGIFGREQGM